MSWLRLGWLLASAALAALLLVLLFAFSDLDLASIGRRLLQVPPEAFLAIVLLLAVNTYLSGEKWRLIALRLHQDGADAMPRFFYFAFTSLGVALGQVVPAQLSLVLSRSIGAHLHGGRALVRGATATVLDYFFDLLVAAAIALASLLVLLGGGGERRWIWFVVAINTIGFLLYGRLARLVSDTAGFAGRFGGARFRELCGGIAASPLLAPEIGRRLLAISGVRFLVLVAINIVSAHAIGVDLKSWQIAAALPFSILANALALTPGGLGLTEWAASAALFMLGISFDVSAQWVVVSRVLVAAAAFLCGAAGLIIMAAARSLSFSGTGARNTK